MKRRAFLAWIGGTLAVPLASAQKPARIASLGLLSHNPPPPPDQASRTPFMLRMRQLGWIEGQNLRVERAFANREIERLPELAASLVAKGVDAIWAGAPHAAVAAARATRSIPIVFANVTLPVELGLVDSLARPGRNVTGVGFLAGGVEQAAKPLEYLRPIAPQARRLASLWTPSVMRTVKGEELQMHVAPFEAAVAALGFELSVYEVFASQDYDSAFEAIGKSRSDALFAPTTPLNWTERKRIVEFAGDRRLASAFDATQYAQLGGLVSYGPDVEEIARQSAEHVDRVLRGTPPAELPVELPRKHDLWINQRTARALGLTVPPSLLLRADKVIE